MSIEIDLTDIGGSRVFDVKECCKEEKCCPCADRIECLQAQISQLQEQHDNLVKASKALLKYVKVNDNEDEVRMEISGIFIGGNQIL